ncbi:carbohydrate esterase family 4 protein [Cylindrobasidium torrendii FP15055 ss-10]|uniref:Carbohydrate esterase family 4 protein n=1 Tax=Cylindrobasidium torrendii FP15055 ss-10 TaxID=1314674 RepID=A0A0D7AXC1_9AGAR|nr:carbohydrate esterase family 4 protein [Cylindrobasidium torrendii FP15055 ss-10]
MLFNLAHLTVALLAGAAVAHPTGEAPERRQQAEVISSCRNPNQVALTFDDGPYNYIWDIVGKLNDYGAKATFFFNGNNYKCIYDNDIRSGIQFAYNSGMQLGSHTWSHKDLSTLSWDQVHDEMWRVEQALQRIVGVTPAFMRPPYGNYNDNVLAASAVRGQKVVIWDFDSGDSVGASAADSKSRYDQFVSSHPSNLLALNHETYSSTAYDVLPHALQVLTSAGYQLVTVAECLGYQPYQNVGSPESGSWSC